eukprot:5292309-Pleurochrysis_carterae.AAC.3
MRLSLCVNEKPTPSGLSMKRRLNAPLHAVARPVSSNELLMPNGPISVKRPKSDEAPGPPCSHSSSGASAPPLDASTNVKKELELVAASIVRKPE